MLLERGGADDPVEFHDLGVGEARVGLRHCHQLVAIPEPQRVIAMEPRAAAVAGLGVEQHGVDFQRLDLPLPPVAPGAAHAIRAGSTLEHQPLHATPPRLRAEGCQFGPRAARDERREEEVGRLHRQAGEPVGERHRYERLEPPPPLGKRQFAEIHAPFLEQVVGHEHAGDVGEHLVRHPLAAGPLRERREGQQRGVAHGEQFTVEHGAGRKRSAGRGNLGKGLVDEFLAAAPDGRGLAAADELRPHAIPLPLRLPVAHGAEILGDMLHGRAVERGGEKERVGPAAVGLGRLAGEQPHVGRAVRRCGAHQPVGHLGRIDPGHLGQGAGHEGAGHAHAAAAREELVPDDPLPGSEPSPDVGHDLPLVVVGRGPEVVDRALHHFGEAEVGARRRIRRRIRQEQRKRLGEVAHVGVALLDQPGREPRRLGRPAAELAGRDAPELAGSREHRQRAGGVVGRCGGEVVAEGGHLVVGARRRIEPPVKIGETLHEVSVVTRSSARRRRAGRRWRRHRCRARRHLPQPRRRVRLRQ